jgi:RimJ/RimL family protein N-acetyltransferase
LLEGNLLILRPLLEEDFETLYQVASDPLIWEQHPAPDRYKRDIFWQFFRGAIDERKTYAIIDKATNQIIGASSYYKYTDTSVTIGFTFLSRAYWGGLYNSELKKLMLDYAFRNFEVVYFEVGEKNFRSQKALEKIGATLVGESKPGTLQFAMTRTTATGGGET